MIKKVDSENGSRSVVFVIDGSCGKNGLIESLQLVSLYLSTWFAVVHKTTLKVAMELVTSRIQWLRGEQQSAPPAWFLIHLEHL